MMQDKRQQLIDEYVNHEKKKYDTAKFKAGNRLWKAGMFVCRKTGLLRAVRAVLHKMQWWQNNKFWFHYKWGVSPNSGTYFYQSFPMLEIDGLRKTDVRIETYKLYDFLDSSMDVLDVGCNIGFFDMSIAGHVKSVTGLEFDQEYVDFANRAAEILEISNARFIQADFNEWVKGNNLNYDVVLSFAVYKHIGMTSEQNAEVLWELVKPNGYLVFESHLMVEEWAKDFPEFCAALEDRGFETLYGGTIEGDEHRGRIWKVFRKKAA